MYEAASVLGIEPKYMVSDYEDFESEADEDTNIIPLFFKKKITDSKGGEKKLTLNAAFKQVFGEVLEPLGFIKAKTKYPYYIRFVDNSFIQIIGLKKESESVINAFERALDEVKKWVLPEFERVQTLSDVIDYLFTFYIPGLDIFGPDVQFYRHINDRDGLFCFELDNPYEIADRRAENAIKRALYKAEHNIEGFTETDYVKSCEEIKQSNKERKEYIGDILNNKHLYDETISEINKRKKYRDS